MKHTPGPLVLKGTSPDVLIGPLSGGYTARIFHPNSTVKGCSSLAPPLEECEGNGHLYAAAPELYAALLKAKDTIRAFNGMGMKGEVEQACWDAYQHSPEMKEINAALALANGEQVQSASESVG